MAATHDVAKVLAAERLDKKAFQYKARLLVLAFKPFFIDRARVATCKNGSKLIVKSNILTALTIKHQFPVRIHPSVATLPDVDRLEGSRISKNICVKCSDTILYIRQKVVNI